jgi:hypothetical protein
MDGTYFVLVVVKTAFGYPNLVFIYLVYESVFIINASGPKTTVFEFQGLWFAWAFKRMTGNIL